MIRKNNDQRWKTMYCGSNKTALQSQRQIACAMMELIREKPYTQITVSELCKAAGISRQTFYSLFTSRENVIVFGLQANSCEGPELPPEEANDDAGALQRLCRAYSRYLVQNRDLIKLLVDNRIEYLLYDSFFASMDRCACFLPRTDACARGYAASFYAGGVTYLARRYAGEGCTGTAEELEKLLMTLFTGSLF